MKTNHKLNVSNLQLLYATNYNRKKIVTNCKFSWHIPGFDHKEQVCKCNGNIYKTIENTKFVR